jgi:hypothetical protein
MKLELLYLSKQDVESINLTMKEIIEVLDFGFRLRGQGKTEMPPKIGIRSDAVPGIVVIDAGTKTLTSDRNAAQPDFGHGYLVEYPEARIVRCSEEHGEVSIANCARAPNIGERVTVIPNHICPCINLQDRVFVRDDAGALEPWSIDARGKLT